MSGGSGMWKLSQDVEIEPAVEIEPIVYGVDIGSTAQPFYPGGTS